MAKRCQDDSSDKGPVLGMGRAGPSPCWKQHAVAVSGTLDGVKK